MPLQKALLVFGVLLLSVSALLGFVQYRVRHRPEDFARWRVVHAGGTAGAVQLLALSAVWDRLAPHGVHGIWAALVAVGLIFATWAFFFGPLANALGAPRVANVVNKVGAAVAVPAYLALPLLLIT